MTGTGDFEDALRQLNAKTRAARSNGPTPHSFQTDVSEFQGYSAGQPMQQQARQQEQPRDEREVSIVESITDFTNYIVSYLEELAEEEINRGNQIAEHLRLRAQRIRQTGIGTQR